MNRTFHSLLLTGLLLLSGCDLPSTGDVIDQRTPPEVTKATFSPSKIDFGKILPPGPTHSFTAKAYLEVADNDGLNTVSSITYTVFSPAGKVVAAGPLFDHGILPDIVAGDGKFSADFQLTIPSDVYGKYSVRYSAVDKDGYASTTINLPLSVIYSNNTPPVVTNFIAPDTIFVPTSQPELITVSVQVSDQEGLKDIKFVRMTIVNPIDNSVRSVQRLYDDGGNVNVPEYGLPSGDVTAGDGLFTMVIPVPSGTARDIERDFNVFAIDQSDATSNIITKRVRFK
ncbi:MAG: hypothetical protein HUU02_09180 [Bacteroidetes bacterium]|nr:hypothetical protein [Bacteroidota bacterium]